MKNNKSIVVSAAIVTAFSLLFGGYASAGPSFFDQGTVSFDSIQVGKEGVGGVTFFNGTIVNTTTSNGAGIPVTFGDDVRIDGRIWRGATQGEGDGLPTTIDDDLVVSGNIKFNSGNNLTALWNDQLGYNDDNASLWNDQVDVNTARFTENGHFFNLLECVGEAAELTTNLESADYIDCWNEHIQGNFFPNVAAFQSAGGEQILKKAGSL